MSRLARSPVLNPIEHMWEALRRALHVDNPLGCHLKCRLRHLIVLFQIERYLCTYPSLDLSDDEIETYDGNLSNPEVKKKRAGELLHKGSAPQRRSDPVDLPPPASVYGDSVKWAFISRRMP
ncbi:hypothetical protein TNIN_306631 [Trichonephila inaurata madagascariensis]|uniref:Transposase n=1 Tax=Trichonephila inaurata madagascariensis TaxID=2747483 RepID=A0A8X7C7S6_9ARAC|nr:hypothetical protein TNIN_306631 [Trichonephila inaurata madagascariensis]